MLTALRTVLAQRAISVLILRSRSFSSSVVPSSLERVGFIGLGNMGFHMANNLINAGYKLTVHDIGNKDNKSRETKHYLGLYELKEIMGKVLKSLHAIIEMTHEVCFKEFFNHQLEKVEKSKKSEFPIKGCQEEQA
ncbi:hypothetical protein HPP92_026025 [Vanilla planifolia]|uniref:3-hydroxyisobutyrate dehydrogenase n=1 Tax=Vanilla planifolia TaxID=51239 RepID=A0A835PK91_VANPL|nr:hypothetical protein HPP92_026025 [Vanilla planifolia]